MGERVLEEVLSDLRVMRRLRLTHFHHEWPFVILGFLAHVGCVAAFEELQEAEGLAILVSVTAIPIAIVVV